MTDIYSAYPSDILGGFIFIVAMLVIGGIYGLIAAMLRSLRDLFQGEEPR